MALHLPSGHFILNRMIIHCIVNVMFYSYSDDYSLYCKPKVFLLGQLFSVL